MVFCTRGGFWPPFLLFLAFCLGYSALAGAIPSYVAPLSAGSGIPEIKAYLNGVRIRGEPCAHADSAVSPVNIPCGVPFVSCILLINNLLAEQTSADSLLDPI